MIGWSKLEDNVQSSQQKVVFWIEIWLKTVKVKLGFCFNCHWSLLVHNIFWNNTLNSISRNWGGEVPDKQGREILELSEQIVVFFTFSLSHVICYYFLLL
jgi:hypothetical protein